jgi:integrase
MSLLTVDFGHIGEVISMQQGTVVRRGNWFYLRFYEPVLLDGKVVKRQKAVKLARVSREYGTAEAVRAAGLAGQVLAPINTDSATAESGQLLAEFLELVYLPHVRAHLKPSTFKGYNDRFKLLKPHIEAIELRKVRTPDIERFMDGVAAGKPRSNQTFLHLKAFLSGAFRYAQRKGLVVVNPVIPAKAPTGLPKGETSAYNLEQIQKMLNVLDEPGKTIVFVLAFTGLRIGELLGLRWEDIDGDVLHIRRSVYMGQVIETKTAASNAAIPLLPVVRDVLAEHRKRSAGEFIFSGVISGKPLNVDNPLRLYWAPALAAAGINWRGWHGFRRGVATNLHVLGVDDLTISRILRHSSVSITQQAYIKTVGKQSQAAMGKLARAFRLAK